MLIHFNLLLTGFLIAPNTKQGMVLQYALTFVYMHKEGVYFQYINIDLVVGDSVLCSRGQASDCSANDLGFGSNV